MSQAASTKLIKDVLADLEEEIGCSEDLECFETVKHLRRIEVLIRKLAREAGYDLGVEQ